MSAAIEIGESVEESSGEQTQYLTFMLGSEVFAIGILSIKEIIDYGQLTEVPMTPACVRGVINLRGSVVPVMDMAVLFGKTAKAVTKRTCIVIVETQQAGEREDVGVVVDAVNAVLDIPAADVEPPPAFGANINSDFIQGLGKVDGKFVILLNADRVLAFEQMRLIKDAIKSDDALAAA